MASALGLFLVSVRLRELLFNFRLPCTHILKNCMNCYLYVGFMVLSDPDSFVSKAHCQTFANNEETCGPQYGIFPV